MSALTLSVINVVACDSSFTSDNYYSLKAAYYFYPFSPNRTLYICINVVCSTYVYVCVYL